MRHSTAIIGGGPAGLMAAGILAKAGHHVTVYDRKPTVGRKFLMAGRGGLNLTHSEKLDGFLARYGAAQNSLSPIIDGFTPDMLRAWCEDLGQETFIGSSGRIFPRAMKASPLLRAWLASLETLGVEFKRQHHWTGWNGDGALIFTKADGTQDFIKPDTTLLALGGASWPDLGSDGSWVDILIRHGIAVRPLKPSNCGFVVAWSEYFITRHAGHPLKNIALTAGGRTVQGEVIIGKNGIEGGAIYALSSTIRDEIETGASSLIHMDLRPNMTLAALEQKLDKPRGRQSFSTWIQRCAGLNAIQASLLREVNTEVAGLTPNQIAASIKAIPLRLTGPFSIRRAISTAGGIPFDTLTDDLMIRKMPGVFIAGEMLDWEAPTGGYLLQACFATGVHAAKGILNFARSL